MPAKVASDAQGFGAIRRPGFLLTVVPTVLYVAAVLYSGTMRGGPPPPDVAFGDKWMHALAFGGMELVAARAAGFLWPDAGANRRLLGAFLFAVAVGGALELIQSLLPYRSAEWLDLCADAVGAGFCALAQRGRAQRAEAAARDEA